MTDYGQELTFGSFLTPIAGPVAQAVDLAVLSERAGLDLVTFQDHPYQPAFHDTWTLMSFVAARTERIRLSANVHNTPLRQPAMLARAAASLDLLSGGRVELALGAGGFPDAVAAMGGPRYTPGQAVRALGEVIEVIRAVWDTEQRGGVRFDGEFHRVWGAKRGPTPLHPVSVWIGAYKPRLLRLTGQVADGWLPSLMMLEDGLTELAAMSERLDDAAREAGRDPASVKRLLNISGEFTARGSGLLRGPAGQWARELAGITLTHGTSGFLLMSDEPSDIERFAHEVAPEVRELVAAERGSPLTDDVR